MAEATVNKLAFIDFYNGTMINHAKTEAAKRPIFDDVEMVRIRWAGNTKNEFHAPATDRSDRPIIDPSTNTKYWPIWKEHPDCIRIYEAFKHGQAVAGNGTPLEEWAYLTAAKRAELKAINIMTVDQMANLDPIAMKRLGMEANEMKKQAALYLERAAGAAVDARLAAEKEDIQRQLEELRAQMSDMLAGKTEAPAKAVKAPKVTKVEPEAEVMSDSPFSGWEPDDIRAWIKEADPLGAQPHHKLGKVGLCQFADDLNDRLKSARSQAA